jgi:hypothetical protein
VANSSRAQREAARRARVEQLQREQRAKERRRTLTVIGILGVVIIAVIVAVSWALVSRGSSAAAAPQIIPSTPTGPPTVEKTPTRVPNPTDIKGVMAWDTKGYPAPGTRDAGTLENQHVTGPVTYAVTPPVGGPHNPVWMNAGVYTAPIPPERAVHNLEHGAIWITYRPNLPAAQVKILTDFVGQQSLIDESTATRIPGQSNRFMDLSPWSDDKLPAPIVISAWGYQLRVTNPSDPRLQQFVDTFRHNQKYTPEPTSPVDGQPVQTSGRAAEFGGTKPNPPGVAPSQ